MRSLALAAMLSLALVPGAFAKGHGHAQCRGPKGFIKCPAVAAAPINPAPASAGPNEATSAAMGHHPICKKGKPCGGSCIAMNKVCHKPG